MKKKVIYVNETLWNKTTEFHDFQAKVEKET